MNKLEFILTKIVLNFFYWIFSRVAVDEKKIVFATPRNDTGYGNIRFIIDEIKRQGLDYKLKVLAQTYGYRLTDKIGYLIKLIANTYELATAKIIILDNAYLPIHIIKHRKESIVIQTWHACGAFKKFGLSTKGLSDGIKDIEESFLHKGYDYAVVSSRKVVPYYAEAFALEEKRILALGVPRTDFFFNETAINLQRDKLKKSMPNIGNKKILLYAPTFRGRGQDKYIELPFDLARLKEKLYPDYFLIVKSHPHARIKNPLYYDGEFTYLVQNRYSLNQLFTLSDILITDYSSGIYEFALMGKPMIFYPYDYKHYKESNDFYEDYHKFVPGPVVTSEEELITAILEEKYKDYDISQFAKENFEYLDGKSSKRFVDCFIP